MADGSSLGDPFWAADTAEKLVDTLQSKESWWWQVGVRRGYWRLLQLAYAQAQGMDPGTRTPSTQQLTFCGPQAKFIRFRINETRSYVKQQNVMAQGQRPSFQCLATNGDFDSLAQVGPAQSIMDYLYRSAKGEQREQEALESDGFFGSAFMWGRWNPHGGYKVPVEVDEPEVDPATKQPKLWDDGTPITKKVTKQKRTGAPKLDVLYPWDVVQEPFVKESPWRMVREKVSKYELAAKYPEHSEALRAINNLRSDAGVAEMFALDDTAGGNSDLIFVRHFYYPDSPELPGGRYVGIAGDLPLWDDPCPVADGIPVLEMCSGKFFGTSFGYADSWDLLAIQEMIDELLSQAANNIGRFGNQSLWAEDGVEMDQKAISEGGKFFTIPTGKKPPQVIQWEAIPESCQWLIGFLIERMQSISGLNSTVRGQPETNITSGAFAALMQNIAQQYVSGREASLDRTREGVANMILEMVRAHPDQQFLAEVAGVGNEPYLLPFTAQSLSSVKRVQVQTSNPLLRSIPGRLEIFDKIKDLPISERAAAVQLITTGNTDGFTDKDQSTNLLIQYENDNLIKGVWCEPSATDDPLIHNPKHRIALDKLRCQPNPDPNAIDMLQEHMAKHALAWFGSDMAMNMTLGIPPSPMQMPMDPNADPNADPSQSGSPGSPSQKKTPNTSGAPGGADLPNVAQQPAGASVQKTQPNMAAAT